jgi:hypothetical protein
VSAGEGRTVAQLLDDSNGLAREALLDMSADRALGMVRGWSQLVLTAWVGDPDTCRARAPTAPSGQLLSSSPRLWRGPCRHHFWTAPLLPARPVAVPGGARSDGAEPAATTSETVEQAATGGRRGGPAPPGQCGPRGLRRRPLRGGLPAGIDPAARLAWDVGVAAGLSGGNISVEDACWKRGYVERDRWPDSAPAAWQLRGTGR